MVKENRQTSYDRETQAQTLASITLGIFDLIEFLKHPILLFWRDATAGVPNLYAERAAVPAPDDNASLVRIANRVGNEVAEDALQQQPVRHDNGRAITQGQREVFFPRRAGIFMTQPLQ